MNLHKEKGAKTNWEDFAPFFCGMQNVRILPQNVYKNVLLAEEMHTFE